MGSLSYWEMISSFIWKIKGPSSKSLYILGRAARLGTSRERRYLRGEPIDISTIARYQQNPLMSLGRRRGSSLSHVVETNLFHHICFIIYYM
jgi:hypothetical protein